MSLVQGQSISILDVLLSTYNSFYLTLHELIVIVVMHVKIQSVVYLWPPNLNNHM